MKSHTFKPLLQYVALAAAAALVGFVGIWFGWQSDQARKSVREARPAQPASGEQASAGGSAPARNDSANAFVSAANMLATALDSQKARATLDQLRAQLKSMSPAVASRAIRQTLDSRADAPTGMEFKPGANGTLAKAPTLRTFLLDQLAQADPAAAAAYAERILSSPDSPDEWAVSLRNYALARTNTEARAFLQQKFRELIHQDPWRSDPSVGFLEAFDVAVHVGGTELLPDLTALLRAKDNQAVTHAAYLALDRLIINEPAVVLGELHRQLESMEGRETTRANLFARADLSDPAQKTILENYLLDARIDPAELETFTGLYPNANYMVSYNLLTRTLTPDRDTLVKRDRQALQTVQQWLADPRFAKVQPQLEKIRQRLEMFVNQAGDANAGRVNAGATSP